VSDSESSLPATSRTVAKADSRQFVRIEFARSIVNISPGEARHPWYWCILVQDGHVYAISPGSNTLAEAVEDFLRNGVEMVEEAEARLAGMYTGPYELPYDVAVVNPENKAVGPPSRPPARERRITVETSCTTPGCKCIFKPVPVLYGRTAFSQCPECGAFVDTPFQDQKNTPPGPPAGADNSED